MAVYAEGDRLAIWTEHRLNLLPISVVFLSSFRQITAQHLAYAMAASFQTVYQPHINDIIQSQIMK
jgi:hypothetical protein